MVPPEELGSPEEIIDRSSPPEALEKLNVAICQWTQEHIDNEHPWDRRRLGDLVEFLDKEHRTLLDILTQDFASKEKFPERPTIHLGGGEGIPDVWLLGWREGDKTSLHDHYTSEAAIRVLQGEFKEHVYLTEIFKLDDSQKQLGAPVRMISREMREGSTMTIPTPYIHVIHNDDPHPDISLHAYWPHLDIMTYYEAGNGQIRSIGQWANDDIRPQCQPEGCNGKTIGW